MELNYDVLELDDLGKPARRDRHSNPAWVEPLPLLSEPSPDLPTDSPIALSLMQIPSGVFTLGAPQQEEGWHPSQSPQQSITVASFWMGAHPITQAQWHAMAQQPPMKRPLEPQPACFTGANRPVEQISWWEAVEFCDRLAALTQRPYRLPSEAEWEYACRAGTTTPFHLGNTITTDVANYSGENWEYEGKICSKGFYGQGPTGCDRRETTPVGSFATANAWGLYDMHGLVREWCADSWHPTYDGIPLDGAPRIGGNPAQRVLRGGSWNSSPRTCRSAFRSRADADSQLYDIGFRVVCSTV
jgi:formylglycine-generating enzyme required for sulfatase activity